MGLFCHANGSSSSEAVAIDSNPPVNVMTDAGSTRQAADDPWKSGLRRDESYLIASVFGLMRSENKLAYKRVDFSLRWVCEQACEKLALVHAQHLHLLYFSLKVTTRSPSSIFAAVCCINEKPLSNINTWIADAMILTLQ